jgi:hypothetical protein
MAIGIPHDVHFLIKLMFIFPFVDKVNDHFVFSPLVLMII